MSLKNIGQDALSSITGNIESAYITIHDYRKQTGALNSLNSASAKLNAANSALSSAKDFNSQIAATADKLSATRDIKAANATLSDPMNDMKKRFRVQFNPAELQIYSSSLQVQKTDAQRKEDSEYKNAISSSSSPPTIDMTVNLFFDQVRIYDAFMSEKLQISASGITDIVMAGKALKGDKWSVQTEVEGFIAALRNPLTQKITFNWETFVFEGSLSYVSAQYTMFSLSGRPIRAKVMMRLKHIIDDEKLKSWYDDFNTAFSGPGSNLVHAEQYVSNLLNLSL